jgi:hypothetical protein
LAAARKKTRLPSYFVRKPQDLRRSLNARRHCKPPLRYCKPVALHERQ